MEHYFYHGFEMCDTVNGVKHMINILKSGEIKKRNEVNSRGSEDKELDHICLYRKNEEFNYNTGNELDFSQSARSGWIDNCMVLVISNDINAKYLPPNVEVEGFGRPTDLVDEWRCFENIPVSKIVGIAIPINHLKEALSGRGLHVHKDEIAELKSCLMELIALCTQLGLEIHNSEEKDFTDKLDSQIPSRKKEYEIDR